MSSELEKKNIRVAKSPFGYFGSKHKLALPILEHIPPHNAWVDAFCGSAAVTLAKSPAPIEIINDINDEIVNVFEVLRTQNSALCRAISLTPYSRKELFLARETQGIGSNLERARKFLVTSMMAINGVFGQAVGGFSYSDSYTRNGKEARVSRWNNLPFRLEAIVERLKNIRIENKDARELIKNYLNRPATLLYLDPPYFADRVNGYDFDENNEQFHRELLELVTKTKCMVMISGYKSNLYQSMLNEKLGWREIEIATHTQGSNGKRISRTEILWLNHACLEAKRLNSCPITLTKKEEKIKKVNPVR